uniref:Histone domain-containing protein n=1 Tax=Steinernema glaseri TaxID=37863 RepID=A0A1I7Y0H9_9BILA
MSTKKRRKEVRYPQGHQAASQTPPWVNPHKKDEKKYATLKNIKQRVSLLLGSIRARHRYPVYLSSPPNNNKSDPILSNLRSIAPSTAPLTVDLSAFAVASGRLLP